MRLEPDDGIGAGSVGVVLGNFAEHFSGTRSAGAEGGSGRRFQCSHMRAL
jgi:hypothetical protein